MARIIGVSLVLYAVSVPLAGQEGQPARVPSEKRRVVYRVLGTGPAKPFEPAPGDEFSVDSDRKEIVIGCKNASGVVVRYRIPLLTNVAPEITSALEFEGDVVRYSYHLTNAPAARQAIELFAVGTPMPEKISDDVTPGGFSPGAPSLASFVKYPRYNWDATYQQDLSPGKSAGPFGFRAPLLPGLSRAYVAARIGGEAVLDRREAGLSMWLGQKLDEAWRFENNTVQPIIIGPKFEMSGYGQAAPLLALIRHEFVEAAALPEFRSEQARLTALRERLSGATPDIAAVESEIKGAGTNPLQKSFYQAMAINLAYLGRI